MNEYTVEIRPIKIGEYQLLRNSTNWRQLEKEVVEKALDNDLFAVCVMHGEHIVGMGRVIGDGGIYFYIQDVVVLPEYQGKGIGHQIMLRIEHYLQQQVSSGSFIGLMAAQGVKGFYQKFGYRDRPDDSPGMFKTIP